MDDKKTLLLVGGGTGGHIVPILNIYKKISKENPEINVVVVGGKTAVDKKMYENVINYIPLSTGKLHRSITINNIIQIFCLVWGFIYSLKILRQTCPNLIFSKAGYISLPIIFWAKLLKIPYFIHESDIEMGAANKFAAKKAEIIFSGFPEKYYPRKFRNKIEFSGQVLRPEITLSLKPFEFGFLKNQPVIFITGGSQGSKNINKAVYQSLNNLLPKYNIIHHTGELDFNNAIEIRSKLENNLKESYYISGLLTPVSKREDPIISAIKSSKLVISRASATTLAEIGALKKPVIAVPYKFAASDHQTKNALFYKKARAIKIISDDDLKGERLEKEISKLFEDKKEMDEMAKNAHELLPLDGLSKICKKIIMFLTRQTNTTD